MRSVNELNREEAADIVQRIVDVMYLEDGAEGSYYNPDKPLEGADFIDSVATILREYRLPPEQVERLA